MGNTLPRIPVMMSKDKKQHFERQAEAHGIKPADYMLEMVGLAEKAGFRPGMEIPLEGLVRTGYLTPHYKEYLCSCGYPNIKNLSYGENLTCMICGNETLSFVRDVDPSVDFIDDDDEGQEYRALYNQCS